MASLVASSAGTGLRFAGMADLGIGFGFDLQFSIADRSTRVYLCVGSDSNRVLITGTTQRSRQAAVLDAIDTLEKWGESISLWMVAEKEGSVLTKTPARPYQAHVKPLYGELKISDFAASMPPLRYPGNGCGRLLSRRINGRYYFLFGGRLETANAMRGFDCTTFPMSLMEVPSIEPPKRGRQLCEALGATKCDLEQMHSADLAQRFKDDSIPPGKYVLFSEGHVLLYDSDINTLYESNYGGFFTTLASEHKLVAKHDLWWMRKLGVEYYAAFM